MATKFAASTCPCCGFHHSLYNYDYESTIRTCNNRKPQESAATNGRDMFSVWHFVGTLAFDDIIRATENFNDKYIIGT
jgi:hypothetical protein